MENPDYNLLPVNAIHQSLLLLRDILESHNDNAFSTVLDRKEMHAQVIIIVCSQIWLFLSFLDFCPYFGPLKAIHSVSLL